MSMGSNACTAEQIFDNCVRKIVGDELYNSFQNTLEKAIKTDDFCYGEGDILESNCGIENEDVSNFVKLCKRVADTFALNTNIRITLCYHDMETNGDRYDEVDGFYWNAEYEDLYGKSPALLALEKLVDKPHKTQFYTIFG